MAYEFFQKIKARYLSDALKGDGMSDDENKATISDAENKATVLNDENKATMSSFERSTEDRSPDWSAFEGLYSKGK